MEPLEQLETLHAEAGLAGVRPGVRASMGAAIIAAQLSLWRRCAGGGTQLARMRACVDGGTRRESAWA